MANLSWMGIRGRNYTIPALDVELSEARATFETNVIGVVHMCQAFAPLLIQAKGTIVQLGSLAGVIPYVFGSIYNASKAALHAYSNTLRVELAPLGVTVIVLVTGGVQSRLTRTHRTLPASSYYQPLAEDYVRRQTHSQEGAMPTKVCAEDVANKVLRRNGVGNMWGLLGDTRRRWYWVGAKVGIVWAICGGWVWNGVPDLAMERMFKLWKLKGSVEKKGT
jgi:1-acylglycerone phosphate reductase